MAARRELIPKTSGEADMDGDPNGSIGILWTLLEYYWVVFLTAMGWILRKIFVIETRLGDIESFEAGSAARHEHTRDLIDSQFGSLQEQHRDILNRLTAIDDHLRKNG